MYMIELCLEKYCRCRSKAMIRKYYVPAGLTIYHKKDWSLKEVSPPFLFSIGLVCDVNVLSLIKMALNYEHHHFDIIIFSLKQNKELI